MTLLQVEDVHQQFGALNVLNGISLAVPRGQALGVVGPNGAGKTTLIDIVAGGRRPGRGRVRRATGPGWGSAAPTRCPGPSAR
jgi:ABC-type branched-subunit amino acid transport system ATPase component